LYNACSQPTWSQSSSNNGVSGKPYTSHRTVLAHSTEVVHCAIPLNSKEYNVMQNMYL
jgi:hypothetical protein